jgi:hypothetical protein
MIGKIATLATDTNTHRSTLQVRRPGSVPSRFNPRCSSLQECVSTPFDCGSASAAHSCWRCCMRAAQIHSWRVVPGLHSKACLLRKVLRAAAG